MKASRDTARRKRRRFGVYCLVLALVLVTAGALLSRTDGIGQALGTVALAQGIGLLVAGAWLAVGHNPLDRQDR